ncbi:hypothetical protein GH714_032867 [Hevea brasiliensis]|uniref:SWIM-type domain-containing protein n=1 Tax=Hevea brasiliensis TaxID=3981 RepID=A0A6A6LU21_HEVBR|nr:hypothetical protein GH714_032867 [Hevea brasiliensis]
MLSSKSSLKSLSIVQVISELSWSFFEYWCSYGPEDCRDSESGIRDGSSIKPVTEKGSRPGRHHMMRGCICQFTVKCLYIHPFLAFITYNQRKHMDKTGAPCYGILDLDTVGIRAMYTPRILKELRQKVRFMLCVGISLDNIIQHHAAVVQGHGGPHNRDDFLTQNDVRNMERVVHNYSHKLHANDDYSVKMWVQRHHKIRSLLKKCCNIDVQREMFKHLGWILYSKRSGPNVVDAIEEFMQVYVDQSIFMDYFRRRWLPCIELWVNGIKSLPVAGAEPLAAIESYHTRLKLKLFNERHSNSWMRIDWLIRTLTTEFHSLYLLDQYSEESGYFANIRDESFSTNSWHQALHISDIDVMLDEQNLQLAKVISQTDRSRAYTVWNPGTEFSLCDCPCSRLGNLCKHVIKVAILCKSRQLARPILAVQVYRQALLTLLQNPPDDPLVLEHAILHATRHQRLGRLV